MSAEPLNLLFSFYFIHVTSKSICIKGVTCFVSQAIRSTHQKEASQGLFLLPGVYSPTVMVWAWHLWFMQNRHSPWLAKLPEYRYCIQKSVAVETMRSTRAATPQSVPPPAKVYSIVQKLGEPLSS